jgi:hypothetical protein
MTVTDLLATDLLATEVLATVGRPGLEPRRNADA